MLRTGILMPRSTLFPALGMDWLNGLKYQIRRHNAEDNIKIITENAGFGINEQEVYSKTEKLLLQEDADIVIAFVDARMTELLQPLFTATNKILIAANFGANLPDSWQPAPTTISHSLNFSFNTSLTGQLAATESPLPAANVISYYDGGYTQCYSMLNAHHENGGRPQFNHVTSYQHQLFTLQPLAAFLQENNTLQTILSLYAGDLATLYYREAAPLQQAHNLNIYVSPMLLDESLRDTLAEDFSIQQVKGYTPWNASLDNAANRLFCETVKAATGKMPNYFHLLGWDTGALLYAVLEQYEAGKRDAASAVQTLINTRFESPRGWLEPDAATHHCYGPAWLVSCSNRMELKVLGEAPDAAGGWKKFTHNPLPGGETSSWRNTYLCI
jgi:branched-chain amino acid transport system substrate-binding protein